MTLDLPSGAVEVGPNDVELARETRAGWGLGSAGGVTVGLDLDVTRALRRLEGLAREVVHAVQGARKAAGLQVTDRIDLAVAGAGEVGEALAAHGDWIRGEVLAVGLESTARGWSPAHRESVVVDGVPVEIALRPAGG